MKTLLIILAIALSGCTTITYETKPDGTFKGTLRTVLKSVDGVYIETDDIVVKVDKTHTGDPIKTANDILDVASRVAKFPKPESE